MTMTQLTKEVAGALLEISEDPRREAHHKEIGVGIIFSPLIGSRTVRIN